MRRQKGIERSLIARAAQLGHHVGFAQDAGNPRQGFQMIGTGGFRCQKQEDQIDRLVVECFEVNG